MTRDEKLEALVVNRAVLASVLGVTGSRIGQLVEQGIILIAGRNDWCRSAVSDGNTRPHTYRAAMTTGTWNHPCLD